MACVQNLSLTPLAWRIFLSPQIDKISPADELKQARRAFTDASTRPQVAPAPS